jgi:hypothetical protein
MFCVLYPVLLILGKLNEVKINFQDLNLNDLLIDYQGQIMVSACVLLSSSKV